ncbi:MAG: hypothetical protein ABI199_00185 [Bacteroidia bacterium]
MASCHNTRRQLPKAKINTVDSIKITKVIIQCASPLIETIIDINCDDFEGTFKAEMEDTTITDSVFCNELYKRLKEIKLSKDSRTPDVRVKTIIFFSNNTTSDFCMRGNCASCPFEYNNKAIMYNKDLVALIWNNLPDGYNK